MPTDVPAVHTPPRWVPRHRPDEYTSSFESWEARASVRSKPAPAFDQTGVDQGLLFPPELVPALGHPLLSRLGEGGRDQVLTHALFQYHRYTVVLEQAVVLPVTTALALGESWFWLPERMRADAFKITTDEAWHAQFSDDFITGVAKATGIVPNALVRPAFADHLARIVSSCEPRLRPLAAILFAVTSETLISALLADIPKDRRLAPQVRAVVADHAEDEGRHHAYFKALIRLGWPQLSPRQQAVLGVRVPEMVTAFLEPDRGSVTQILKSAGLSAPEVATVVHECYPKTAAMPEPMRVAARGTVRAFDEAGALDCAPVADAFAAAGLFPAAGPRALRLPEGLPCS